MTISRKKMSQEQPQRPRADQEPIKYGDVFHVSSQLVSKTIAPRDAATAQAADNKLLGQTPSGGSAGTMESAAAANEQAGLVGYRDATCIGREQGVKMSQTFVDGNRVVNESLACETNCGTTSKEGSS